MNNAPCDMCGRLDALPVPHRVEALCPACAARASLLDTAHDHLHAQLAPVLTTWARYWQTAGLTVRELGELLEIEGAYWHPRGGQGREECGYDAAQVILRELLDERPA